MDNKRPLTEQELWKALMNDSEDENEKELRFSEAFSDISSEEEDNVEDNVGNILYSEYESDRGLPLEENDNHNSQNDDQSPVEGGETQQELQNNEDIESRQVSDAFGRRWSYIAPKIGRTRKSDIVRNQKSLTEKSKTVSSIIDCFKLFISEDIIKMIVVYTNQRAKAYVDSVNSVNQKQMKPWIDTDAEEIYAFLGLLLLTGRFRESREDPHNLWSALNASLSRPIYQATMSRNRFVDLLRFIRFDDLTTRAERKQQDKLAPIREVTTIFAKNCRDSYVPSTNGTVDEQLVSFRGRCPFRVYIPTKPGKYGIKIWALCDSENFYCCNFEVYIGKEANEPERNQGPRVVKTLVNHWFGSGRNVTCDNFFTDITLAEELLTKQITIVGTIRKNRKDLPKSLIDIKSRALYSSEFLFTNDLTLVSYITKPRKFVVLLSSVHHEHEIADEEQKYKPEIILSYNRTKSGVDVLDKLVREYSCKRSTRRWPFRLFMNYLDVACYNAFVIWMTKCPEWNDQSSMRRRRKSFLQELGLALVDGNISRRASQIAEDGRGFSKAVRSSIESTGRDISKRQEEPPLGRKRGRCHMCHGNDNKYQTKCVICKKYTCGNHGDIEKQKVKITCLKCKNCEESD